MISHPVLEGIIAIDILSNRQNFHISSPKLWSKGHYGGKDQVGATRMALPRKKVNGKQHCISGGIAGIAITKDLKHAML